MNNQLVVKTANPYLPDAPGETLAPPVFKLVQAMSHAHSEDGVNEGKFFSAETGEVRDTLKAVILSIRLTRTYWEKGNLDTPICFSLDRIAGGPGGRWEGALCANCAKRDDSPWLKAEDMCLPGYVLLAVEPEAGDPFMLRVSGTSANTIRLLRTLFKTKHNGYPFRVAIEFTAKKEKNPKGTFFVLKFKTTKVHTEAETLNYKALADTLAMLEIPADADEGVPVSNGMDDTPF